MAIALASPRKKEDRVQRPKEDSEGGSSSEGELPFLHLKPTARQQSSAGAALRAKYDSDQSFVFESIGPPTLVVSHCTSNFQSRLACAACGILFGSCIDGFDLLTLI